jgi:uncharacterized protein YgbK (DUF1537 family)
MTLLTDTRRLGCIADDFTGATDLANNLVRAGMRVAQTIGVPTEPLGAPADAIVVALKTRTVAADDAIAQSLQALAWLQAQGIAQFYFKVCSTFDSTPRGNIGPVTDALMDALGCDLVLVTPAFPDNQRSVYKGHLFVGDLLLSDSAMRQHPLTPMTDANLVRVLQAQSRRRVGLIDHAVVGRGAAAIVQRMTELRGAGIGMAIVDAIDNADLMQIGAALRGQPLVTAGSGVAIGLPANWGIAPSPGAAALPAPGGLRAVVSGSCSAATNAQVRQALAGGMAGFAIDPLALAAQPDGTESASPVVAQALAWAEERLGHGPVVIYATAEPDAVQRVQQALGVARAGALVERALSAVAAGLVRLGVRQLVVAGGETAGAVVQALGITQLQIGPQIDPGVPWCAAQMSGSTIHLALKSGNFGSPDFFAKAFAQL